MEPFLSEKQQTSECPNLPGSRHMQEGRIPRCEQLPGPGRFPGTQRNRNDRNRV